MNEEFPKDFEGSCCLIKVLSRTVRGGTEENHFRVYRPGMFRMQAQSAAGTVTC